MGDMGREKKQMGQDCYCCFAHRIFLSRVRLRSRVLTFRFASLQLHGTDNIKSLAATPCWRKRSRIRTPLDRKTEGRLDGNLFCLMTTTAP